MIDRITTEKILDSANIVDVVSDFVTLRRAGANFRGLCPFHDDTTPSFMVSPAKNLCKCFACGEGGSPVGFIMKHEQLSYPDALRYLAKKYGIEIKERELTDEEKQAQGDRDSMFLVNEWARDWFQNELYNTPDGKAIGLAYFRNRGFRDDILKRFQVGFCPDSRTHSLSEDAIKAGYQEKYLVNVTNEKDPKLSIGTGLSLRNDKGRLRDRYYGRVIWPIFTVSGRVAGFGGRVLDAATKGVTMKYVNSPESIIYSKKKELFGLFQAKEAIRKRDLCYMVEGYTDVMAMHQHGVENVVASSGTALTTDQIRLIHRMTNNITVIYDGDAAGIHASERGIDMLLAEGMNVKLLLLPDGDDPDSFARKHTATEYQQYLAENQIDFINYKTSHIIGAAKNDPKKLGELVHSIATSIAAIPDEITRVLYIRQEAQSMRMDERLITDAVNKELWRMRDEKRKEQEREARRQRIDAGMDPNEVRSYAPTDNDVPPYMQESPVDDIVPKPATNPKETVIIQMVVRHGEKVALCIEDENGELLPLTVAEFVMLSMKDDDMTFTDPLYNKVLDECLAHVKEEGFQAEPFFMNNPDPQISGLAFNLCTDQVPLSKVHDGIPEDDRLDEILPNLLANLKLSKVQADIARIIEANKNPSLTQDERKALMLEFNEKNKLARELAKECGARVILK